MENRVKFFQGTFHFRITFTVINMSTCSVPWWQLMRTCPGEYLISAVALPACRPVDAVPDPEYAHHPQLEGVLLHLADLPGKPGPGHDLSRAAHTPPVCRIRFPIVSDSLMCLCISGIRFLGDGESVVGAAVHRLTGISGLCLTGPRATLPEVVPAGTAATLHFLPPPNFCRAACHGYGIAAIRLFVSFS